jgi:maltokinase
MGHFLTEKTGFAHTPALLGHVEAVQASETCAVGIVHRFVPNQGDAWTYSADRINIYLDAIAAGSEGRDTALTVNRDYIFWIRRMGRRVAEMHRALSDSETPEFKPEPIEEGDLKIWTDDILTRADRVLGMLEKRVADLDKELLARVLRSWHRLPSLSRSFGGACMGRCKTRHHGDLHWAKYWLPTMTPSSSTSKENPVGRFMSAGERRPPRATLRVSFARWIKDAAGHEGGQNTSP